jgi:hypothetical protein
MPRQPWPSCREFASSRITRQLIGRARPRGCCLSFDLLRLDAGGGSVPGMSSQRDDPFKSNPQPDLEQRNGLDRRRVESPVLLGWLCVLECLRHGPSCQLERLPSSIPRLLPDCRLSRHKREREDMTQRRLYSGFHRFGPPS